MLPMASLLEKSESWNSWNTIPMHLWLVEERSQDHDDRMGALGNLVVPPCARAGLSIASSISKSYQMPDVGTTLA